MNLEALAQNSKSDVCYSARITLGFCFRISQKQKTVTPSTSDWTDDIEPKQQQIVLQFYPNNGLESINPISYGVKTADERLVHREI